MDSQLMEIAKIYFENNRYFRRSAHLEEILEGWLRTHIGYSLFESCVEKLDYSTIEDYYKNYPSEKQRLIIKIADDIQKYHNRFSLLHRTYLVLGQIPLVLEKGSEEYEYMSIYCCQINAKIDNSVIMRIYFDNIGRCYEGWNDFVDNNRLPPCYYVATRDGLIEQNSNTLEMYSSYRDKTLRNVLLFASSASRIVTLVFPLASVITLPIILASGVIEVGISIQELVDRAQHGQSMFDVEGFMCWFNILFSATFVFSQLKSIGSSGWQNVMREYTPKVIYNNIRTLTYFSGAGYAIFWLLDFRRKLDSKEGVTKQDYLNIALRLGMMLGIIIDVGHVQAVVAFGKRSFFSLAYIGQCFSSSLSTAGKIGAIIKAIVTNPLTITCLSWFGGLCLVRITAYTVKKLVIDNIHVRVDIDDKSWLSKVTIMLGHLYNHIMEGIKSAKEKICGVFKKTKAEETEYGIARVIIDTISSMYEILNKNFFFQDMTLQDDIFAEENVLTSTLYANIMRINRPKFIEKAPLHEPFSKMITSFGKNIVCLIIEIEAETKNLYNQLQEEIESMSNADASEMFSIIGINSIYDFCQNPKVVKYILTRFENSICAYVNTTILAHPGTKLIICRVEEILLSIIKDCVKSEKSIKSVLSTYKRVTLKVIDRLVQEIQPVECAWEMLQLKDPSKAAKLCVVQLLDSETKIKKELQLPELHSGSVVFTTGPRKLPKIGVQMFDETEMQLSLATYFENVCNQLKGYHVAENKAAHFASNKVLKLLKEDAMEESKVFCCLLMNREVFGDQLVQYMCCAIGLQINANSLCKKVLDTLDEMDIKKLSSEYFAFASLNLTSVNELCIWRAPIGGHAMAAYSDIGCARNQSAEYYVNRINIKCDETFLLEHPFEEKNNGKVTIIANSTRIAIFDFMDDKRGAIIVLIKLDRLGV